MTTIHVSNPRTGANDYSFEAISRDDVALRCTTLRLEQKAWASKTIQARCETLQRWRDAIANNRANITAALTIDTGRHMMAAIEVDSIIEKIDY